MRWCERTSHDALLDRRPATGYSPGTTCDVALDNPCTHGGADVVSDPNTVPPPAWFLLAVSVALFAYAWVLTHHRDAKWKRHARDVGPAVMNRQMVERLRQSATERMPR